MTTIDILALGIAILVVTRKMMKMTKMTMLRIVVVMLVLHSEILPNHHSYHHHHHHHHHHQYSHFLIPTRRQQQHHHHRPVVPQSYSDNSCVNNDWPPLGIMIGMMMIIPITAIVMPPRPAPTPCHHPPNTCGTTVIMSTIMSHRQHQHHRS